MDAATRAIQGEKMMEIIDYINSHWDWAVFFIGVIFGAVVIGR